MGFCVFLGVALLFDEEKVFIEDLSVLVLTGVCFAWTEMLIEGEICKDKKVLMIINPIRRFIKGGNDR